MQTTDWTAQAIEPGPHPSRLDTLIHALCPDGVEYVKLETCCNILDSKRKPVTKAFRAAGIYPYYGANGIQDYVSDFIFDGTFVLVGEDGSVITERGTPIVTWAKGKIWVNNHAHIISEKKGTSLRYLYHYIQTINVSSLIHGNIPKLTGKDFRTLSIPLPPLEVQEEIVRILDKFSETTTALVDNLQAEYEGRKKQYAYYRDKLLTFPPKGEGTPNPNPTTKLDHLLADLCPDGVEYVKLKDVTFAVNIGINPRKFFKLNPDDADCFYVTVRELNGLNGVKQYKETDKINKEAVTIIQQRAQIEVGDILFSNTGTVGKMALVIQEPNNWGVNEGIYVIKPIHEIINNKYLYYFLSSHSATREYTKELTGSTVKHIAQKQLLALSLPLPPLEVQEEIVRILDKFDTLTHDLTEGLPAEIEAREKQYTYYRDKLLTFPKKTA